MNGANGYALREYGRMISDRTRTSPFVEALRRAVRPGAVVLDIGTGTGIFALLACQFGAARVYAIEPDDAIEVAKLCARNIPGSDCIVWLQGFSTDTQLPERVDVVIGDLHGMLPMYNANIASLIDARRRHLKPGGQMIPKRDVVLAVPAQALIEYANVESPWVRNDHHIDFGAGRAFVANSLWRARPEPAAPEDLLSSPCIWGEIDYSSTESPNLDGELQWRIERPGTLHGLYVWFDAKVAEGLGYSNAPDLPELIYGRAFFPLLQATDVMVGDPGTVNVANAYAMGVRGFDTAKALQLMEKSADNPLDTNRWGLADWLTLHFTGNAATTQEYAMADFALSQFALELGDSAAHGKYLARSSYWKESWNPDGGFIEPRVATPSPGANAARLYEVQIFGPAVPATNLALGGTATASASCSASEGPEKAINGTWTGGGSDKWCDNTSPAKWWQVDLLTVHSIDKLVVYHAGAGGESSAWNTQDFVIQVSTDASAWTTVATVAGNSANVSTHPLSAVDARFVRLQITTPIQGATPGAWDCQPFDPAAECGFIEGNGAQYVWMVPHDLEGLFTRMGGHAAAVVRLDDLFTELNAGTDRPYFYIGNEPEHGTPWTYNFAQAPAKTQAVVRRIVNEEFGIGPGGLPGNDDLGATSAWLVWSYLGLYPMIPGTDILVLNGPAFPKATVHLANGNTLTIKATGAGAPYIQSLQVDGQPSTRNWLRFKDLSHGASVDYSMGATANGAWGSGVADVPPSFSP